MSRSIGDGAVGLGHAIRFAAMTEQAAVWRLTADKWTEVADAITDDDWSKPTTVRRVHRPRARRCDHAMHWQAMGGGIVGAGTAPGDAWDDVRPALSAALEDPSNLDGTVEAFGGMPKQQVLGLLITDLLVHSWDLARSLGVDETLPPAAVEAALIGLQRMPEEQLRSGAMFAPAVEVADDASAQDRLIAFTGRRPPLTPAASISVNRPPSSRSSCRGTRTGSVAARSRRPESGPSLRRRAR